MHSRQKLCRYVAKAKLFSQKTFFFGVFIWGNFHPGCDLGCGKQDLGNLAGPRSHMPTSKFEMRGDLGNRASSFNRAHMKRP